METRIDVTGIEDVLWSLQELDESLKRAEMKKIFSKQIDTATKELKNRAPLIKPSANGKRRTITYHRDHSIRYKPGNLKRSIKKYIGKNRAFPTVYTGASVKKAEGSGYYGYFVQKGTSRTDGRSIVAGVDNYVDKAFSAVGGTLSRTTTEKVTQYIKKEGARLGFEVR